MKRLIIQLATYLQQYGKDRWNVSAFTRKDALDTYLKKHSLDIIIGTDKEGLKKIQPDSTAELLWLANRQGEKLSNMYTVYRFQGAKHIGKSLDGIVRQKMGATKYTKPMVAVYSPVGRCGKTTLALEVVRSGEYGNWLYIGMEDYSSFRDDARLKDTDRFLYHWKERNRQSVLDILEKAENVVVSGTSFFDIKEIVEEDMRWLKDVLQSQEYTGMIFDVGSGVLERFELLGVFEHIMVPYVEEERAMIKKEKFQKLLEQSNMEDVTEKVCYINMDKRQEVRVVIQKVFGGI